MTRYRKMHIIPATELRRGVMDGTSTKALCGRRRVRTPEDIDAIKDLDLPLCKQCGNAIAALTKEGSVNLRERTSWEQLEKDLRPRTNSTVRITTTGSHARWDFPLAG